MDFEDLPFEDIILYLKLHNQPIPQNRKAAYDAAYELLSYTETDIPESILDWYNMPYYDLTEDYSDLTEYEEEENRLESLPEDVYLLLLRKLNCRDLVTMGNSSTKIAATLKTTDVLKYGIRNTGYSFDLGEISYNRAKTLCRILSSPKLGIGYIASKIGGNEFVRISTHPYVNISASQNHYLLLDASGSVYSYGDNHNGEVGLDPSRYFRVTEIMEIPHLSNIINLSAGDGFSLFVDVAGHVHVTGNNYNGQLGLGHTNKQFPIAVNNYVSDIIAVSAGHKHSLFLSAEGQVYGSGSNIYHQLGLDMQGTYIPRVISPLPRVTAIEAGIEQSLFLTKDGQVYACGSNGYKQLGFSNSYHITTPSAIPGLPNIVFISSRYHHSLFVTSNGKVYGCGDNYYGQLGMPEPSKILVPTLIPGLPKISRVFTSPTNSFFLTPTGKLYRCGQSYGARISEPITLVSNIYGVVSGVISVSDTANYTLLLKTI